SALQHSRVMIHQPSGGMQGQSKDMEISLKLILSMRQELYQILANHTGKTYEEIERDSDRDYWLKAPEAKEYGLIDEVLVKKSV
ncbi:MAG: ATP-dependent Clp protease proteolytic subunit, partial [Cyclobacteriaceae bacterium]|nr:ATP-dependent Clp protease proteolytic subunit [Cyclobacteriaceae bacterium]